MTAAERDWTDKDAQCDWVYSYLDFPARYKSVVLVEKKNDRFRSIVHSQESLRIPKVHIL